MKKLIYSLTLLIGLFSCQNEPISSSVQGSNKDLIDLTFNLNIKEKEKALSRSSNAMELHVFLFDHNGRGSCVKYFLNIEI